MEEFVGQIWDLFITRVSTKRYPEKQATLSDMQPVLATCFRAFGGASAIRIVPADLKSAAATSNWLQQVAGTGSQFYPTTNNQDVVSLPPRIDIFPNVNLNESLYLYLTALAAQQKKPMVNWFWDNQQLALQLHKQIPGYKKRYRTLLEAYLPLRPDPNHLSEDARIQELALQQALKEPGSVKSLPESYQLPAPIALWLYPATHSKPSSNPIDDTATQEQQENESNKKQTVNVRKKSERVDDNDNSGGLMLFRLENLFSWTEYSQLDRNVDDNEDDDAASIAEDLEVISVSQKSNKAARIKFDLDLPAEAFDDTPLGPGLSQPEWNYQTCSYHQNYCHIQPMLNTDAEPQPLPDRLKATANKIRNQFEMLQPHRHWERKQTDGEEIDIDSWLSFYTAQQSGSEEQRFYKTFTGKTRELSCLLLADLSMSTSAYVNEQRKVIDLIKDSILLFSEALNATQDKFAIYGFSSARRKHVRFNMIKNFNEKHSNTVIGRIQMMKPGFYTRMGAAIRQANDVLEEQRNRHRILMIVSDGKPNDIDHYEGRYGIEDTRQAVIESKQKGIIPFCITIDQEANDYLPYIFGSNGYVMVSSPEKLPNVLPLLYSQLTNL